MFNFSVQIAESSKSKPNAPKKPTATRNGATSRYVAFNVQVPQFFLNIEFASTETNPQGKLGHQGLVLPVEEKPLDNLALAQAHVVVLVVKVHLHLCRQPTTNQAQVGGRQADQVPK